MRDDSSISYIMINKSARQFLIYINHVHVKQVNTTIPCTIIIMKSTALVCLYCYLHQFPNFIGYERWLFYQLYYDKQECKAILNLYQSYACQTSQYHYSMYYNYNEVYSIYIIIFINFLTLLDMRDDSSISYIMINKSARQFLIYINHVHVKQVNSTTIP